MCRSLFGALAVALACQAAQLPERKIRPNKEVKEPVTQTLPPAKDPPAAIAAETAKLSYRVSPLSSKGLLSQQVRDALKALARDDHGAIIVKLRAFVAGTGDMRRVQQILSEEFTERKLPLPVLSTIQVGALPMEGAQVVLESVAMEKKAVNPNGLAFLSGQRAPTVDGSIANLKISAQGAGVQPSGVLRVTCFLSSIGDVGAARTAVAEAFPMAVPNYVQLQRQGLESLVECEAIGRLDKKPASAVAFLDPPGLEPSPRFSQCVLVKAPQLVFTSSQMVFRDQDADIRLAFERLQKALESLGAKNEDVFWTSMYPLTTPILDKARPIRAQFYGRAHPPGSTTLLFEGLPSLDATMAMDVIAVAPGR